MPLSDKINDPAKKKDVISDCCTLVDEEVAQKSGISGLAVKAGYAAVKGVKPGFIPHVVGELLPDFARALDGLWDEGVAAGKPAAHLVANKARAADALLGVTDEKAKKAKSGVVRSTYDRLRGSAKKHVEDAVPRLSRLLEKHAS